MAAEFTDLPVELPELGDAVRYVARQPILDLRGQVRGYELLFRSGPEAVFRGDNDIATRTMLDNAMIFGLGALTAGLPAFLNCTAESLIEGLVEILPPSMTVLEILETLEPTPELVAACRRLKTLGYRFALDDFTWMPKFAPLVELADYIKVDFQLTGAVDRQELMRRIRDTPTEMLAEKVETQEEQKRAHAEGFTLFQGYYFCRPTLMRKRKIPANQLAHLQMLEALQHDPLDLPRLSELVKQDASLAYRFFRLVNSPLYALRQEVRSINAVLLVLGDDAIRRVAMLAIVSEMNANQPQELLRMALVRARFCELAASTCALRQGEQYLLGMFSMLPAMLQVSAADIAPLLPLRETIRQALRGAGGIESSLLRWMESHERGDWKRCNGIAQSNGLDQDDLARSYAQALVWAETGLHSAS